MRNWLLIGLAILVAFAAGGYLLGRSTVTSEAYMLGSITNAISLKVLNGRLVLELSESGGSPYWTLDLLADQPAFQTTDALFRAYEGTSLSAEGQLLLMFLGGGAATTTAASVYRQMAQSRGWKSIAIKLVAGATGYLVGYYVAITFAKPSDREIQEALRNPDIVEKVKKYVYISLLNKYKIKIEEYRDRQKIANKLLSRVKKTNDSTHVASGCGDIKDRVKCSLLEHPELQANVQNEDRSKTHIDALLERAVEALSNDKVNLKGDEFSVFVLMEDYTIHSK